MDKKNTNIPNDIALQDCRKIQQQCQDRRSTYGRMHCMGNTIARKVDQTELCVSNGF
jgi:hypothetical protein